MSSNIAPSRCFPRAMNSLYAGRRAILSLFKNELCQLDIGQARSRNENITLRIQTYEGMDSGKAVGPC